jgi:CheY-like chemotaxis protein
VKLQVLIVDDSPSIRLTLLRMLQQCGIPPERVQAAGDAAAAEAAFAAQPPDLVLLDVELDLEGSESAEGFAGAAASGEDIPGGVLLAERWLERVPTLKLVVATGLDPGDPSVRRLIRRGAFDVLQKPLRLARVREVVRLVEEEELNLGRTR